jgi:hypothetical protein
LDLTHSPCKNFLPDLNYFIGSLGHPVLNEGIFDVHDAGPWTTSAAYIRSSLSNQPLYITERSSECIAARKKWLAGEETQDEEDIMEYLRAVLNIFSQSVNACLSDAAFSLLSDPNAAHFTIHHLDLHSPKIMISYDDTTLVTGIVDWESAAVLPVWSNPTGQRLLDADERELLGTRLQILNEQVPYYQEICDMAKQLSLNYLITIIQYGFSHWMERRAINDLHLRWVRDVHESYVTMSLIYSCSSRLVSPSVLLLIIFVYRS